MRGLLIILVLLAQAQASKSSDQQINPVSSSTTRLSPEDRDAFSADLLDVKKRAERAEARKQFIGDHGLKEPTTGDALNWYLGDLNLTRQPAPLPSRPTRKPLFDSTLKPIAYDSTRRPQPMKIPYPELEEKESADLQPPGDVGQGGSQEIAPDTTAERTPEEKETPYSTEDDAFGGGDAGGQKPKPRKIISPKSNMDDSVGPGETSSSEISSRQVPQESRKRGPRKMSPNFEALLTKFQGPKKEEKEIAPMKRQSGKRKFGQAVLAA